LGRLGPYRVLKVLGSGGMGVVYHAEDIALQRPVALKALLPSLLDNVSARERFLREARSAAAIKHDHIVSIYQVGEDRSIPFLAMEFLEGRSLDERLEKGPPLSLDEVLRFGLETADGLAAAHQRGLIHRDIKPANLWLESPRDRIKILDFGLARAVSETARLTQQGTIVGTPAYMSPEQARAEKVDARTDLFSLGCVLYRMATGQSAFTTTNVYATLQSVCHEVPPVPTQLVPDLPPELSDLIQALLAKDPADRPDSAQEVGDRLRALQGRSKAGVRPSRSPDSPPQLSSKKKEEPTLPEVAPSRKRPRWILPVVGGLILLCVLLGAWIVVPGFYETPVPEFPPGEGFVRLFNEKNLDGWQVSDGNRNNWQVVGPPGRFICTHGWERGWLLSNEEYGDYEMVLEYRLARRADSGVAIRAPPAGDPALNGLVVKLVDDRSYPKLPHDELTGSLFRLLPPREGSVTTGGWKWNRLLIRVQDQQVRVAHNGQVAIDADLKDLLDHKASPGRLPAKGHVGFQSATERAEFRYIWLRELSGK
jgi:serine/threonine protein kinase